MNLDKMRAQRRRLATGGRCGARYSHAPGLPIEVCALPEGHRVRHDWPSVADLDPTSRSLKIGQSNVRLAGVSMADIMKRAVAKGSPTRP